jgi:archaeosine-15-forming tRNA-guanine transglycosylase
VPAALEDLNPFAHLDAPQWVLRHEPEEAWIASELQRLGLSGTPVSTVDVNGPGLKQRLADALAACEQPHDVHQTLERELHEQALSALRNEQVVAKQMVLLNTTREVASSVANGCTYVTNREGRVKNVNRADGQHLYSPRLRDGGMSLANAGAQALLESRNAPLPTSLPPTEWRGSAGNGPAVVVVDDDAEPFVRKGRNVFHGFVLACDPWLLPGEPCLVVNKTGTLLGHGTAQCTADEMQTFSKGIAVKTRGGLEA